MNEDLMTGLLGLDKIVLKLEDGIIVCNFKESDILLKQVEKGKIKLLSLTEEELFQIQAIEKMRKHIKDYEGKVKYEYYKDYIQRKKEEK